MAHRWTRVGLVACLVMGGSFAAGEARAQDKPAPVTTTTQAPAQPAAAAAPAQPATPRDAPTTDETPEDKRLAPNSVFAEGLGPGLLYSINYERLIADQVGLRVGFSYLSLSASAGGASSSSTFIAVPITANYVGIRSGKSALELGAGGTVSYVGGSSSGFGVNADGSGVVPYGVAMVGYRLHPVGGAGFQFRIGLMALAGPGLAFSAKEPGQFGVLPWGYISFGAGF